jgi:predicted Zn-dependent protease
MALLSSLWIMSCTTDYVTGKQTFSLVSESQEVAMGKEADPQIVAQFGSYDDPKLSAFVADLGQRLARKSQRSQLTYTFRVLDSPVINAFALPGGYVYVTRGILANFNSEDELAGVLGHEIGHVVARHSAEQMSRQQLAGLGLGLGSLVSEKFAQFAELAGTGISLMFLSFSRAQESESDMLGVEYSTKLGYDAHKMAGFFRTLKRMSEGSGQSLPSFLSTHPDPGNREVKVNQLTNEWQRKVQYRPLNKDPKDYLNRIDGIVYGDDPQQGYVENQMFYHPGLRFQFPVPQGWKAINSPTVVQMVSSGEDAIIQFTLGKAPTPGQEADDFVTKNEATVQRRESATVHGYAAEIVDSRVESRDGTLGVLSYFIKKDENVFVFHGFTLAKNFRNYSGVFAQIMGGFEKVTNNAVLSKKPDRLRVERASRSGSLSTVLQSMGMPEDKLKELAIVNGMELGDNVKQGDRVKVVRQ